VKTLTVVSVLKEFLCKAFRSLMFVDDLETQIKQEQRTTVFGFNYISCGDSKNSNGIFAQLLHSEKKRIS